MSHCTNINHPQIQEWAERFKTTPETIGAMVSLWQQQNNDLEEFPSNLWVENQINYFNNTKYTKQGVEELFDSNPELANQVYEALGFDSNLPIVANKEIEFLLHKEKLKINLQDITLEEEGEIDLNLKNKWNTFAIKAQGKKLGYIQVLAKDDNTVKIGLSALYEGKEDVKQSIISKILNLISNLFKTKKVEDSGKRININAGKGIGKIAYELLAVKLKQDYQKDLISDTTRSEYAENLWKSFERQGKASVIGKTDTQYRWDYYYKFNVDNQITPQQKQQAQQLYSQYLQQNPNGSVEQFKNWVEEFNRNKSNLDQQSQDKTVNEIYKENPYLENFINSITDQSDDISIYKVKNILDKHGEGRIIKLNKILYNAINRLWDNNIFAKNNIKIKFVDSLPENAVGNFNRDDNEITIDKRKFLNNVINNDKSYPIFYLGYILNHEIIHYLTPKDLSLKIEYADRALEGRFGNTFELEHERKFGKNIKELYDIAIKELSNDKDYGLVNLAEFVAEAMSNPSFQEKLASIPFKSSKQSLWKRFVEILSAYLSLDTKKPITDTLLEAVIAETTNYITENSNIQRTYKRRNSGKTESIDIGYDFLYTTQKNITSLSDFISQKSQENNSFQQFQQSLNNPNTNPILQGNQEAVITPNDKIVFGHPGIGKTFLRESGRTDVIDFDSDYKSRINEEFGLEKGFKARNAFQKSNKEEYQKAVRKLWIEAKKEAKNKGKQLFASDMILLREFANDFDKVITMSKETFVSRAKQRNDYTPGAEGTEGWKQSLDTAISNVDKSKVVSTDKYLSDLFTNTQQEQVKKFNELQERLNNKEFLEGAKSAFESSEELQNVYYEALGVNNNIVFETERGSVYYLNNGKTKRDKKTSTGRIEKFSESDKTVYITEEDFKTLRENSEGIKDLEWSNNSVTVTNDFNRKTTISVKNNPEIGLIPLELVKGIEETETGYREDKRINIKSYSFLPNGVSFHAGHKIVSINPQITPQQKQDALNAYTDYLARVSLGIIKNPSSGEYNYTSKVKDIVYHGSPESFEQFDKSKLGSYTGAASAKEGIFFGSSIDVSKSYLDKRGQTLNLNQFIENKYGKDISDKISKGFNYIASGLAEKVLGYKPERVTPDNEFDDTYGIKLKDGSILYDNGDYKGNNKNAKFLQAFIKRQEELKSSYDENYGGYIDKNRDITDKPFENLFIRPFILSISNPLITSDEGKTYREESYFERIKNAKEQNKDGVVIQDTYDSKFQTKPENVYVVFEPEQIHILGGKQDIQGFKEFVQEEKIFLNKSENEINNSDKYFKDVIQPLIKKLSKKFPNIKVTIISENELPENLKNKNINSYYKNNEVFIIKEKVTPEITIEEFLHPFVNVLKESNEELYKSLLKEAKQLFPELRASIKDNYKNVYDNKSDIDKEFLTQVLSKKVSQKQLTLFEQFKKWLKEILFGKTDNINIEDLDIDMKLGDVITLLSDDYVFNINDYSSKNEEFYSLSNDITDNFNSSENPTKNIWNQISSEENKLISQQFEHIEVTRSQKQTVEKVLAFGNDLAATTDDNYILKNNTILKRTSSIIDEDSKFKFDKEDFDEEKYAINRKWGNQIDDILRAVLLYRFDSEQETKVIEEIKKQREKRNEESVISDSVIYKLISEFNKFAQKNNDKVLIPQVFLYNEDVGIGGTADIVMINKYGNVQVVDLKSSLYPVGWNGKFFESYDKEGVDGKIYKNNYTKTFGENRGSKKQRHEAQLSMYIGMMLARGINYNENKPVQILPVHIKELNEYSEEIIEDVIVERDDAPMDLNNDYLQKVSIDSEHNNRVLNNYETDFEQNKNKLIVFIKTEIQLLRNIKDKKSYYRIKDLEEMLKKLEDNSIANVSKLSYYITDLHKTFISGNYALVKQIRTLTKKIKSNDVKDVEKAIKELVSYKEKIILFTPLINDLEEFYRDISEDNVNENDPDSMLYKLDELLTSFKQIDKFYKKTINPLIAEKYTKFTSSEKSNKQVNDRIKRFNDKLSTLRNELEKLKTKENSISKSIRIKYLNQRINFFENSIYNLQNNAIITKETILKQLNEGSYEDISFFQKVALAPQSSSNIFIAGTAKIIDNIWDNIRMTLIKVQEDIHEAFEEFASSNKDKNRNNPKEFNEGLYETITTGYIQDKQLITVEDIALVQKTDVTKYNKERQKFLETIKDLNGKEYWEEYNKWYSQNTEGFPMEDEVINGYVIKEGLNSIIKDKQEDVKNNIITQNQYDLWFDNAFNTKKENGKKIISGVRFDTKEGRQLRQPSSDKYTNDKWLELQKDASKLKYYNKLLTTYFKSQENYPSRKSYEHKFILPYINKSDLNRISENGLKNEALEKVKRLKEDSIDEQKKVYGESKIKVIPILYNDRIEPQDVSLDLAQSILKYEAASQEFKARIEIEPIMKSLLYSISENKPVKTDSKGRRIINKFAEELNLPGLDKYVKEGDSNIEALLKYYLDNAIYGISRQKATIAGNVDIHNIVDGLSGVISKTSLGLPFGLFSNIANWLQAEAQTSIEAYSRQFFDTKTYLWAEKEYLKLIGDFMKDMTAPIKTTLIGQLIDLYDPFVGEFKDKYGHNISKDKLRVAMTSSPQFFLQNLGEHHVQLKTMLAFLKTTKIKDKLGNEISLYDAYTNKDENGNEIKLKLKDGIDLSQLGELSDNKLLPFAVKNTMSSVLRKTHGNYSSMSAPMLRKYWYGRVIEFMRRFFATSVEKRWRQTRYNFEEQDLTEGYNITFWRLAVTEFKELSKVGFGFATNKNSSLTELELSNLRRNAMDMAWVFATGLLVLVLKAMMKNADSPEEKEKIALFLAPIMRLNAELSAFGQIGDPSKWFLPDIGDIKRNISNPTVMYGYITKTIQFIEQIPQDLFSLTITGDIERYTKNTGFYEKGDSKLMAKFLKLFGASPSKMDLTESIKALEMIQNK